MSPENVTGLRLGRLFDLELVMIRERSNSGDTIYPARDRHILLDHIDALRYQAKREIREAKIQALRDVLSDLFAMDEDPGIEGIEKTIKLRMDELEAA